MRPCSCWSPVPDNRRAASCYFPMHTSTRGRVLSSSANDLSALAVADAAAAGPAPAPAPAATADWLWCCGAAVVAEGGRDRALLLGGGGPMAPRGCAVCTASLPRSPSSGFRASMCIWSSVGECDSRDVACDCVCGVPMVKLPLRLRPLNTA
eukprot:scaffold1307_cov200-Pinguiococcus_pyrenoidosus.AAC.105